MEVFYGDDGSLNKVRVRMPGNLEMCLTKWQKNNKIYLHINDSSKCFENGTFDKTKTKNISIKWHHVVNLKEALNEMELHVNQMLAEQVRICLRILIYALSIFISVCTRIIIPLQLFAECYSCTRYTGA